MSNLRYDDIIQEMTLPEKARLLGSHGMWLTQPIERLGIKSIRVSDGPHGLRKEYTSIDGSVKTVPAVCYPTAATTACSWDEELLSEIGEEIAKEAVKEKVSILLGPGTNIKRSPLCGRNFEYFSEDPYLSGRLSAAFIKGLQSKGVGACLKHFAVNNQESHRSVISAEVDERTLHEIYLKPFEIAIKESNPYSVMCSYNKINGTYASQNRYLLTDILREKWKYDGVVFSDWGAVSDRVAGVLSGLDLEFPAQGDFNTKKIIKAVADGRLKTKDIDICIDRILALLDKCKKINFENNEFDEQKAHMLARRAAVNSTVLLKNEANILPLNPKEKILVVGELAQNPRYQGSGSSKIYPLNLVTAMEGLEAAHYEFEPGYYITDNKNSDKLIEIAASRAVNFDKIVLFVGLTDTIESEGYDRSNMALPDCHYKLFDSICKNNPNIIVVLSGGSPMELRSLNSARAIICQYLTGQANDAIWDILFGKISPSGKLAETFPIRAEDNPSYNNLVYDDNNASYYKETIFVGYRYYDTFNKEVAYPFGHGLSYTTFSYSSLKIDKSKIFDDDELKVSVLIKNTGDYDGAEIVQLYISKPDSKINRPSKELKAFKKVFLKKGETKEIVFILKKDAFAYYNTTLKDFAVESGDYIISVGSSSVDIRQKVSVTITAKDEPPLPVFVPPFSPNMSDTVFEALLGHKPLTKKENRKRPYTLDSTINDISNVFWGRVIKRIFVKQSKTVSNEMIDESKISDMILDMPLRMLVVFSQGKLTIEQALAVLEIVNGKLFCGLKAFLKASKGKK